MNNLEWIGAAPIFDSGTSLWYNTQEKFISYADIKCKPFKKTHSEQLRLVSDFSVFDFSKLDRIDGEIIKILMSENYNNFIDENRVKIIAEAVHNRIDNLQKNFYQYIDVC